MRASIGRDLSSYQGKVALGLTARTLAYGAAAICASALAGLYCWYFLGIRASDALPAMTLASAPLWALALVKPDGMRLEEWLPLWMRQASSDRRLAHDTRSRFPARRDGRGGNGVSKAYSWLRARRGVERWEP